VGKKIENLNNEILCDYGCGKPAHYQFINGKYCCNRNSSSCPELIRRSAKSRTGRKNSEESNKKQSLVHIGQKSTKKGKTYTEIYGENKANKILKKMNISSKISIEDIKRKYPIFYLKEKIRYNPKNIEEKEIQVRCKHCNNWFTPTYISLYERVRQIEHTQGNGCGFLFCSQKCKDKSEFYYKNNKIDPNFINDYKKYVNLVYRETNRSIKNFGKKIKNIEFRGRKFNYELDHKFSIFSGFNLGKVDPKLVGHWRNLEILSTFENRSKHKSSSISLDQLLDDINNNK